MHPVEARRAAFFPLSTFGNYCMVTIIKLGKGPIFFFKRESMVFDLQGGHPKPNPHKFALNGVFHDSKLQTSKGKLDH